MKSKTKSKFVTGADILIYGILAVIVIGGLYGAGIAYRNVFADMTLNAWREDCIFKFHKLDDGSPQKILLVDLEGVTEDRFAYEKTDYNVGCQQLLSHPQLFKDRYVWLGIGVKNNSSAIGETIGIMFFLLIVLGIIFALVFVFKSMNKGNNKDDDDDDCTYY